MADGYSTLKKLDSDKKSLSVVDFNGSKCVMKVYETSETPGKEAAIMRALYITGFAPEVIDANGNYIVARYIEGEDYETLFQRATMTDDAVLLDTLAGRLCMFLQMFYALTDGYILGRIDFDEFILSNGRCCCVCFAGAEKGMPYQDVAGVVAYAMCHAVGGYYAAYPFVRKILDGFHLDVLSIINDMPGYIDAYAEGENLQLDKDGILRALISFEDRETMDKLNAAGGLPGE